MDITDKILLIASLCTACGVIIATVKQLVAPIKKELDAIRDMGNKIDGIEKHTSENYLSILRLTVMSEEMPLEERLIAGQKYIDAGGNGEVKAYYPVLQKKLQEKMIVNKVD